MPGIAEYCHTSDKTNLMNLMNLMNFNSGREFAMNEQPSINEQPIINPHKLGCFSNANISIFIKLVVA